MSLIMPNGKPQPPQGQTASRSVGDAMGYLRNYAQTNYGKSISDQEFSDYAKRTGFTGDQVNDEQMRGAVGEIDRTYGGTKQPTGPPPSQVAPQPTPLPQNFTYQPQFQGQINPLMQSILQRPETMNQQWQDQRFEQGKEAALDYRKQMGEQARQATAGRGWSNQGGVNQAIMGNLDQNLASQLLAGRRDVATQAATQNRADQLAAIGAASGLDQQGFGNNQAVNAQNLAFWQAQEAARSGQQSFDLQRWLADQNVQIEKEQFAKTYGLDALRFLENQRQFGLTFGEGQRQHNNSLGLNWFNAQNNQNNSLLDYFLRTGGG